MPIKMSAGSGGQGSGGPISESDTMEGRKWPCEYCTYENWPASKRCTLCHAPRPLQLITDNVNEEQDIYKMAALVQDNNSDSCGGEGSSSGTNTATISSSTGVVSVGIGGGGNSFGNKWACVMCTFVNLSRSSRCMQCLSPRHKAPSVQPSSSLQSANVSTGTSVGHGRGTGLSTPNHNPPGPPETTKATNNDINRAVASLGKSASSVMPSSHVCKWSCKVCTYENWQRSTKCTLCGTARGRTLSDSNIHNCVTKSTTILSPVSVSSVSVTTNITEFHETAKCQRWASTATCNPDNSDNAGATGAGTSIVEDCHLKLLRRRLRDKDWLWLNACLGVVDSDPNAIEAFIAAGGNPSRQLTADEVLLLSRPSAFEVGHTLVHLALRFRQEDMLAVLLAATDAAAKSVKYLPCHASPHLASDIRRHIASSLRQRKGDFPCFFFSDCVTFALPTGIYSMHLQLI